MIRPLRLVANSIMAFTVALVFAVIAGCSDDARTEQPVLSPELAQGKQIWEGTCQVCHLSGIAEAPPIGNKKAWQKRIAQGEAVLIQHAIEGFSGNFGTMPARGGNATLTDEEIALAVRYMVFASQ